MSRNTRAVRRITAIGGIALGVIAAVLPALRADAAVTATRISGADRYATSAAISAAAFDPLVDVVYIATGVNFPDALAGAPAAAQAGGPVLLVPQGALPASTKTELDRLDPGEIVVIGGTGAVSDAVKTELESHTDGPVSRVSGGDRYATAAAVSADAFPAGAETVFVATGANFPDALSGGPGVINAEDGEGPLLLVEAGSIPAATATELQRLSAKQVVVLGGTGAVSDAVKTQLEGYSDDPVERVSGADRFATAVAVSMATFDAADVVFLATGRNFPDALSGGSPAGLTPGPMLLSEPTCIPPAVNAEITRLDPESLVVLGGESALSAAVMSRTVCQPPATTSSISVPTPPTGGFVTPGAYCTPAGMPGVTSTGGPMTCATYDCNNVAYDQPRWRTTSCTPS